MNLNFLKKKNKKLFDEKLNKRSFFLRELPKKKSEGLKKIEEEKTEILIDRVLKRDRFERDYKFFIPSLPKNDLELKKTFLEKNNSKKIKVLLTTFLEKEQFNKFNQLRYKNENEDTFDYNNDESGNENEKKKELTKNNSRNFSYDRNKAYRNIICQPLCQSEVLKKPQSFLSTVGNNIVISSSAFNENKNKNRNISPNISKFYA